LAWAVRNAVLLLGLPVDDGVRLATTYPADSRGLGDPHGRIAPDYRADLVVLDDEYRVQQSWIGGVVG
jgi:N-acetylglucosamine-6-phosphate deacetylase